MAKTALYPKTKKDLESKGFVVEKCEYWNPFAHRRIDFLGVADAIALNGESLVLIQLTDSTSASKHEKKILESDKLALWLRAGGKFQMYLWRKVKNRWQAKIREYTLNNDNTVGRHYLGGHTG